MLDKSDMLARKCVYAQGKLDALNWLCINWDIQEFPKGEAYKVLLERRAEAEAEYIELQHKYIDSIGGGEQLKV